MLDELIKQAMHEQEAREQAEEAHSIAITRGRIVQLVGDEIFNYGATLEEDAAILPDGSTGRWWLITLHLDDDDNDVLIVSYEQGPRDGPRSDGIEVDTSGEAIADRRREFLAALGCTRDWNS